MQLHFLTAAYIVRQVSRQNVFCFLTPVLDVQLNYQVEICRRLDRGVLGGVSRGQ